MASPQEARVPGPRRERVDRAVAEIDRFIANLKSELGVLVQTSTPTTGPPAVRACVSCTRAPRAGPSSAWRSARPEAQHAGSGPGDLRSTGSS